MLGLIRRIQQYLDQHTTNIQTDNYRPAGLLIYNIVNATVHFSSFRKGSRAPNNLQNEEKVYFPVKSFSSVYSRQII